MGNIESGIKYDVGIFKKPQEKEKIYKISSSMGLSPSLVHALIHRESEGSISAQSPTGAKGITQLTGVIGDDLDKSDGDGRGKSFYQPSFKKINTELISNSEVKGFIKTLQSTSSEQVFGNTSKKLFNLARNNTSQKGYEANLITGLVYMDALKKGSTNEKKKQEIINTISNPSIINGVNKLLQSKGYNKIDKKILDTSIKLLKVDPSLYEEFYILYNYNGDKTLDSGFEHRLLYALAILMSKFQIIAETKKNLKTIII